MDKVGQDIRQYSAAWYDKMVQIWQDRLLSMGVRDTGALLSSVHGAGNSLTEAGGTISFQFLQYGIYVDLGTGNGNERQAEKAEEKSSFYYIHTIAIYTLIK